MNAGLTIAVDAMSGDHGAAVAVPAALDVLSSTPDLRLLIVGRGEVVRPLVAGADPARCTVVEASEVVGMDERPQDAVRRKKDSSMRVAIDLVKKGEAAACVSAGNTGALLATARFVLGMVPGIDRPAIVSALPTAHGHTVMLDLGANPDCTAEHLVQFAVMGSVIASDLHGIDRPRIGLLNIGEEAIKGTDELREAHRRLAAAPVNYRGFVEGNVIFSGEVDVVVTDGFSGNIALKTMEGVARFIGSVMREEFTSSPLRKLGALAASPALRGLKRRMTRAPTTARAWWVWPAWSSRATAARTARRSRARCVWRSWRRARAFPARSAISWRASPLLGPPAAHPGHEVDATPLERRGERAGTARRSRAPRQRLAVAQEFLVRLDLVAQLPEHQLDHHRVVEQADARDVVRDDVLGIADVGQRGEHRTALAVAELPVRIGQHRVQGLELAEPLGDEVRQRGALQCLNEFRRRTEDLLVVGDADRRPRTLQFAPEMAQVAIGELDGDLVRHVFPPRRGRLLSEPRHGQRGRKDSTGTFQLECAELP
jgi:phosphate acyltransferase